MDQIIMDKNIKDILENIEQLKIRISNLEKKVSCHFCKEMCLLVDCYNCDKKICSICTARTTYASEGSCYYFCAECK